MYIIFIILEYGSLPSIMLLVAHGLGTAGPVEQYNNHENTRIF